MKTINNYMWMVTLYLIIIMYIFIYATTMNFLDFGPVLYNNLIVSLINKYLKDRINIFHQL